MWLLIWRTGVCHGLGSLPAVWHYWHALIITQICLRVLPTCLKCSFCQFLDQQEAGVCVKLRWVCYCNKQGLPFSSFRRLSVELAKPTRGSLDSGIKLQCEGIFFIEQSWVKSSSAAKIRLISFFKKVGFWVLESWWVTQGEIPQIVLTFLCGLVKWYL